MAIKIRPFEFGDYPAALALWQATAGVGLSKADEPEPIARYLDRNPGLSFVAYDGKRLVGTALCGHDGRRGLIHHLVCATEWRRTGLGRQLLRRCMRALAGAGIDKCHLMVYRSNPDAIAFWRAVAATERTKLVLFSLLTDGGA